MLLKCAKMLITKALAWLEIRQMDTPELWRHHHVRDSLKQQITHDKITKVGLEFLSQDTFSDILIHLRRVIDNVSCIGQLWKPWNLEKKVQIFTYVYLNMISHTYV